MDTTNTEYPMVIFADSALQAQYEEKGWVVVDFFSAEDTQYFYDFYTNNNPTTEQVFISAVRWNPDLSARFSNEIKQKAQTRATEILPSWIVDGASYIVKGPNDGKNKTHFDLHQDYNLVDESEMPSLGLWISLIDTDKTNGGLLALPQSNIKFAGTIRGVNKPSLHLQLDEQLEPLVDHISVKAGQACIFSHALFHGSLPNYSDEIRPIIHAGLFTPNAKQYHYLEVHDEQGGSSIEVLEISREYYYTKTIEFYNAPRNSPHKVIGRLTAYTPTPTREDILKAYGVTPLPLTNQADNDNSDIQQVTEKPVEFNAMPLQEKQAPSFWSKIKTWMKE